MNDDKRKVSTDALETLGTIIGETEKRDAIHLAVVPVVAKEILRPGEDVTADGRQYYDNAYLSPDDKPIGIVDPFLNRSVSPGERFWLVIYPRQIHSLRHVWTHPAFPDEIVDPQYNRSIKWLEDYVEEINNWDSCPVIFKSYHSLIKAAQDWIDNGIEFDFEINNESLDNDFWFHYEIVTGKKVHESKKQDFFGCCC